MTGLKLIAFTGAIGSGKTTAAKLLNVEYTRLSFASPLKEMLITMGLTAEEVYGADKNRPSVILGHKTPRHAMQTLGTEWGRNLIGPDLWVNCWARKVERERKVVVDDCRFPNEFRAVRNLGGTIVKIVRQGLVVEPTEHESERYFEDDYDHIIQNPGDLKKFKTVINRLMITLQG